MLYIDLDVDLNADLNADLNVGLSSPDPAQFVATQSVTQLTARFEVPNGIEEDKSYIFVYNFCNFVPSHC
jgi:hypothetical protein